MNKVFINGTAAKYGGGSTILESYLESKIDDDANYYYVFCPFKPQKLPLHCKWVKYSTDGLSTLFFSLFLSFFIALYFRCTKVISFSNLNCIFSAPSISKITYFHNMLILNGEGFKFKILRLISKYGLQSKNLYIFQTTYVKEQFLKSMGFLPSCKVRWPGVSVQYLDDKSHYQQTYDAKAPFKLLVPIMDLTQSHKNFSLIKEFASHSYNNELEFYITSTNLDVDFSKDHNSKLRYLGNLSKQQFINAIDKCDGVIIVSETETLCLPIFEALVRGKPVFVLDKPYVKGLEDQFGLIYGLHKFYDFDNLVSKIEQSLVSTEVYFREEYLKGNWDF
ncbi:hypothetical protein [Shewanella sp. TB7-MNA-CIBAN-0143]|uniref:hypothetical protein n=1 Tax=Shewanella sp. TB7-MNA-CIBAN-0143 TaxID=3140465 RepID=UPI00331C1A51